MGKLNRKRSEHFKDVKNKNLKNLFTFCGNEGTTYLESVIFSGKFIFFELHGCHKVDSRGI